MTTKTKAIVKIYGQEYAIVSDKNREHIQRLSNYVDDKMKEISSRDKKLSTAMVAVLVALNMSEELFGHKEKIKELEAMERVPDKVIKGMEDEIVDLKKLLNERATEIKELENAMEEEKKASGVLARNEDHLKKTIAAKEKSLEEKEEEIHNLEARVDEFKNKLMECELKLVQTRKELVEFMDAFEN